MDARVYFDLQDAIDAASTVTDLRTLRVLVDATDMAPLERRVLERHLSTREAGLRRGDSPVHRPAERAD